MTAEKKGEYAFDDKFKEDVHRTGDELKVHMGEQEKNIIDRVPRSRRR